MPFYNAQQLMNASLDRIWPGAPPGLQNAIKQAIISRSVPIQRRSLFNPDGKLYAICGATKAGQEHPVGP
jgi:hypothetical protein